MQNVVLQFADVIKRYGASTALDGLDLRVHGGELLALLGPNGAGKTTTIKCLCTLVTQSSGTIRVDGVDTRQQPRAAVQKLGLDDEGLGEVLAVVGLFNAMNKLADAYQIEPDILPQAAQS